MGQYTQLALRIWNDRGLTVRPGSPQEADLEMLQEFATRMGRLVHKTRMFLKNPEGPDFVAGAYGHLFATLEDFVRGYNARHANGNGQSCADPYVAWARTVLTNHYYDHGRRQKRFQENRRTIADERIAHPQELVYNGGDGRFAPYAAEVQTMEGWEPIDRVVTICILRCWENVPGEVWERWIREAGLEEPFPPASFIDAPKGRERAELGRAMGMTRNAIDKRISRLKNYL